MEKLQDIKATQLLMQNTQVMLTVEYGLFDINASVSH